MFKFWIIFLKFTTIYVYSQNFRILDNTTNLSANHTTNLNDSIPCKNDTHCNYGICNNISHICECNHSYVHTQNNGLILPCYYKLKKQYNTFILELIIGFGAGQFYSLRYAHGILKLLAYVFGISSICLFPLTIKKIHTRLYSQLLAFSIAFIYCGLAIGFTVWYIYDLVMIKNNKYKDGNGFPLLN